MRLHAGLGNDDNNNNNNDDDDVRTYVMTSVQQDTARWWKAVLQRFDPTYAVINKYLLPCSEIKNRFGYSVVDRIS